MHFETDTNKPISNIIQQNKQALTIEQNTSLTLSVEEAFAILLHMVSAVVMTHLGATLAKCTWKLTTGCSAGSTLDVVQGDVYIM